MCDIVKDVKSVGNVIGIKDKLITWHIDIYFKNGDKVEKVWKSKDTIDLKDYAGDSWLINLHTDKGDSLINMQNVNYVDIYKEG